MSSQQFRTNNNNKAHPITPPKGVTEASFREGQKNILGTPSRQFSSGIPMSERATIRSKLNYARALTQRFDEATASGKARKEEKKREKNLRTEEANKNLLMAHKFLERHERISKGENLPPIDVSVNVDTNQPTKPKNISAEEKKNMEKLKAAELANETSVIEKINAPPPKPVPGPSPAFAPKPSLGSGEPDTSESGLRTEEHYAESVSPAYTTAGEQPAKKDKSKLSLSELALLQYPASG